MLGGVLGGGQGSSLLNLIMSDSFSFSMDLLADGVQKEGLMALHCEWRSFHCMEFDRQIRYSF